MPRHIICTHPLGVTLNLQLYLHRDLRFIAVGKHLQSGLYPHHICGSTKSLTTLINFYETQNSLWEA
jgi:hypothetical protein